MSDDKSDYFINSHTGNRTSKLIAKKKPDGKYETETEIKARLAPSWNVMEVDCEYDESGNCITSPAHSGKKARRNRKSKSRRKAKRDAAAAESTDNAEAPVAEPELPEESLKDQTDGTTDVPNSDSVESETPLEPSEPEMVEEEVPEKPAEDEADDEPTELLKMTHAELKDLAKRAGVKVSGTKADLIAELTGKPKAE
jgi:hypothetical protein